MAESETNNIILFFDLCRLCLANRGSSDIFEQVGLQTDITVCTGLKITASDNLPRKICTTCWDIIKKSMELRLLATKNDYHLKSLFEDDNQDLEAPTCEVVIENLTLDTDPKDVDSSVSTIQQAHPSIAVRKELFKSSVPDKKKHKKNKKRHHSRSKSSDKNIGNENVSSMSNENSKKKHKKSKKSKKKHKDISKEENYQSQNTVDTRIECDTTENKEVKKIHTKIKLKLEEDGDAKFACDECSKTFDNYKKYYLHRRLHNKTIVCPFDTCGKKFATKGDLSKHFRTHTGEKPYECEICHSSFTQGGSLKAHMNTVHSFMK